MDFQTILGVVVVGALVWMMMRRGGGGCCGGHGDHAGHGDHSGHAGQAPAKKPAHEAETGTAIDPVCGMSVDKRTAVKKTVDGVEYYFCKEACRDKFTGK